MAPEDPDPVMPAGDDDSVDEKLDGQILSGGAQRQVVRVGNTVHVPAHRGSAYIEGLLNHLEHVGFAGDPRWLGHCDHGHDVLTYVEGTVPTDPPYDVDDDQLVAAAALLRRFHDAVAGTWLCGESETVCHGDLGPHDTVFRDGLPVAFIDWDDGVGPGSRAVDFADAVWGFADVTSSSVPVAEQARRVSVMCTGYSGMTPRIVVEELAAQFERARSNHQRAGRDRPREVFEGLIAWLDSHRAVLAPDW